MEAIQQGQLTETNELLAQTLKLTFAAERLSEWTDEELYHRNQSMMKEPAQLTLIPYHLWGNRGETAMRVWF